MPSTRLYVAYAVAGGISTLSFGSSGIPSFSHTLSFDAADTIIAEPYRAASFSPTLSLNRFTETVKPLPTRGEPLIVHTKMIVHKEKPKLEAEKYNFTIYES